MYKASSTVSIQKQHLFSSLAGTNKHRRVSTSVQKTEVKLSYIFDS